MGGGKDTTNTLSEFLPLPLLVTISSRALATLVLVHFQASLFFEITHLVLDLFVFCDEF